MLQNRSCSVIIPVYDPDVPRLERYVENIREVISPEVVRIEIDAPRQKHVERLEEVSDTINISDERRGKGAAIMNGFDAEETDILAFADADGSVPVKSLKNIISQIIEAPADICIGSRRHPSSNIITHQTPVRRFLGDAFAFLARQLLTIKCKDYQCGAKAVRKEVWDEVGPHCNESGFAWDLEFLSVAGALGYDIIEVPISWKDHPDSSVDPILTPIELATALVDVRRRTDALEESSQCRNIDKTTRSELLHSGIISNRSNGSKRNEFK